jgi:hypothetical protein
VFTGGTGTGRKVMAAAAPNLTPLTLELGGKCPAIILPGADLGQAARHVLAGKAVNAGQTCIAPDTVLLVGVDAAAFATACRASGIRGSETAVINAAQRARLDGLAGGVALQSLGEGATPLSLAAARDGLAREEIFGPILAMHECADLAEALRWIAERDHPLAIYLFGATRAEEAAVAAGTKSGALVTGRALEYAAVPGLAFGGVGASGFGRRNGEAGFREFSNIRARMRHGRWSLSRLFDPAAWRLRTQARAAAGRTLIPTTPLRIAARAPARRWSRRGAPPPAAEPREGIRTAPGRGVSPLLRTRASCPPDSLLGLPVAPGVLPRLRGSAP